VKQEWGERRLKVGLRFLGVHGVATAAAAAADHQQQQRSLVSLNCGTLINAVVKKLLGPRAL
jgi:hypothetical protein